MEKQTLSRKELYDLALYDPFIECDDELLKEVDRETLTLKQKPPYYGS